ncbi:putative blue pigment (indigoidine) exporter [Chitinivorax tropicus]|uniref:Putative blue pigment (Indigoidine) exporter n=1 Tax=Chitinivorax tropicus TaxID=714531 RepID=A0A840MTC5_9PROT|nr:DMT family transporter [Chitinivorax tropicus]MBB5019523.1 putative blue pigment (indigoidine) exporter [Chitinivorax tropicus]
MNSPKWLDVLITSFAPMIWGSTYLVTTEFLPPSRPFTAACFRALPAGLLLILLSRHWPKRDGWKRLVILSALNIGIFQACLFIAAYRLPGGLAAVIGAIQPLLVLGLGWGVDNRKPSTMAVVATTTSIIGMAALLLSPNTRWDGLGIAAAFFGATCMACGTFLARRWHSGMPIQAFTGWQLFLGGLMLVPVAGLMDPPLPNLTTQNVLGYTYLSIFGALIAYFLWFRGIARLPSVAASSLGLLSPVTAVLLGWAFLEQAMRGQSLVGLVVVLASILLVQLSAAPSAPSQKRVTIRTLHVSPPASQRDRRA